MTEHDVTLTRPAGRQRRRSRGSAALRWVFPPALSARTTLPSGRCVIGRSPPEGGLKIADRTVSRSHLELRLEGGALAARDLGSHNGSWLDGERLEDAPLTDGAVLRLGDTLAVVELEPVPEDAYETDHEAFPGDSAVARRVRLDVATCAADPSPVLVLGETGTGKEYLAREVHRLSGRTGPLVAVNCAGLPLQLAESQLFGHVKGAFTGAHEAQPGLFRGAEGGTLFLDEVAELSLELQAKLLRAIQEREVLPVGATRPMKVDVRVVAATHADLPRRVERGDFLRDLFARLSLWEVLVPPLRARRGDLLDWLGRLHRAWCAARPERETAALRLDADAAERVLLHDWPENLRGIDRLVHRLAASAADLVDLDLVAPLLPTPSASAPTTEEAEAAAPRRPAPDADELRRVLEEQGSVRAAARYYGRDRRQIYRWMDQLGLRE